MSRSNGAPSSGGPSGTPRSTKEDPQREMTEEERWALIQANSVTVQQLHVQNTHLNALTLQMNQVTTITGTVLQATTALQGDVTRQEARLQEIRQEVDQLKQGAARAAEEAADKRFDEREERLLERLAAIWQRGAANAAATGPQPTPAPAAGEDIQVGSGRPQHVPMPDPVPQQGAHEADAAPTPPSPGRQEHRAPSVNANNNVGPLGDYGELSRMDGVLRIELASPDQFDRTPRQWIEAIGHSARTRDDLRNINARETFANALAQMHAIRRDGASGYVFAMLGTAVAELPNGDIYTYGPAPRGPVCESELTGMLGILISKGKGVTPTYRQMGQLGVLKAAKKTPARCKKWYQCHVAAKPTDDGPLVKYTKGFYVKLVPAATALRKLDVLPVKA